MSLLSRSQRTQEYITQIFSHCCKVFIGVNSHTNSISIKAPFIVDSLSPDSRTPDGSFQPRCRPEHCPTAYLTLVQGTCQFTHWWFHHFVIVSFTLNVCSGPDAGVKVFLGPGLWKHSGFHDTGEWWGNFFILSTSPKVYIFTLVSAFSF